MYDQASPCNLEVIKLEQTINKLNIRIGRLKDRNKFLENKDTKARQAKGYEMRAIQRNAEIKVLLYFIFL